MRNPFPLWLRLLGIAGEPVSFAVPEPPEAVRARLLAADQPGLPVRPWLDGVRVSLPSAFPLLPDRPRALLRVVPAGDGAVVVGEVGVPAGPALYAYFLPFMVAVVATGVTQAVADPSPWPVFNAATLAFVGGSMGWTVLANRRLLPVLRRRVADLVTP